MTPFPESCGLFVDTSCDRKMSAEDLFRAVVGVDDNDCPVLKTNGPTSEQIVALTDSINALTAAINAM